eukprot:TRINITY_DN10152_c0_g1_i7.p1 TRINITY_DN10152_c0_g1~~TRINITY_DN10152_c0_g1_i7.p1  ORF type:complete len:919 (-),score=267.14 TRINITY_DN10152_c0_g1_i7:154-2817(-)
MVLPAGSVTDAEWGTTIDVAGRQRMLSQRMSKEFLFIAKGFEVEKNKAALTGSIKLFDTSLSALVNGSTDLGIAAAPNQLVAAGLQVVVDLWKDFKALLEDNVAKETYGKSVLDAVAAGNVPLLKKSNAVVGRLVDAAKSAGANTAGLVVDIAGRQRMLIQRMCKEVLLISLDISAEANVKSLQGTSSLFDASHKGIVLGATWAGVPRLTSMCTLQQMRLVSYEWERFAPLVETILAGETALRSRDIALGLIGEISNGSTPLFKAMVGAVKLYVNDDGSCDPISTMDAAGWTFLLNNAGKQRFLGQQVSQLFMQIANGIAVAESKVTLTVQLDVTGRHLRSLIEGSVANNIPAPPTQEIANQLLQAYDTWVNLEQLLQTAVSSDDIPSRMVKQLARLSRQILAEINAAVLMYEESCELNMPSVAAYLINIAGRQRMLYQKMSKEASLISYGDDVENNWNLLNGTRDLFMDVHWSLLLGTEGTNSTPALPKMTHRCFVQQMKVVADKYDELQSAALRVAFGNKADIEQLITLNPIAFSAMNTAVGWITKLPAEPQCEELQVSTEEWKGAVKEIGKFRALTQEVSSLYVLASSQGTSADTSKLKSVTDELVTSMRKLNYGFGASNVPAPLNQEVLDSMFAMTEKTAKMKESLLDETGTGGFSRRLQTDASTISRDGLELLAEAEKAMDTYMAAATQSSNSPPVARMELASRQILLAQKIVKEATLLRFAGGISASGLDTTIKEFEEVHRTLTLGGGGIQEIIPEREDLLAQVELVDEAWEVFKTSVQDFVDSSQGDRGIMTSLDDLMKELTVASELYSIEDPYVAPTEPPPPPFPWTTVIYVSLATALVFVCCIALITAGACKSKGGKDSKGSDWSNQQFNNAPSSNAV